MEKYVTAHNYDQLKKKYQDFTIPTADIRTNDKSFGDNKEGMLIGEVEVELTCGFEASAASYYIYNCVDSETGEYQMKALKPYILLGSAVTILLGYQGALEEVFRGIITQVRFIHEEGEIPSLEVTVMDIKGIMMANCHARQLRANNYGNAVREIFQSEAYQNLFSSEVVRTLAVSSTPDASKGQERETANTIEMASESDYEFVVKAAKKLNYEFYTIKDTLYFRKSKDTQETLMELKPGRGLLGASISYDICKIVATVEARGMDTGKGEAVVVKKKYNQKISQGNKAKSLISQSERVYVDPSIRTREQAGRRAESLLEEMAYRYGELEGCCVGMPELLPGAFLEIAGFGAPADNRFYLSKVRHVLSAQEGYRTYITACAPGLL